MAAQREVVSTKAEVVATKAEVVAAQAEVIAAQAKMLELKDNLRQAQDSLQRAFFVAGVRDGRSFLGTLWGAIWWLFLLSTFSHRRAALAGLHAPPACDPRVQAPAQPTLPQRDSNLHTLAVCNPWCA